MRETSNREASTPNGISGIIIGLGLSYFGAYHLFKLPVVLPTLLQEFGYDRALAGSFMSIYALVGLLCSVWIGSISRRRGPLTLVPAGLLTLTLGGVIALVFPSYGSLMLLSRGLEGFAFAIFAISGPVIANANASERQLPIVIGFTAMWIPVGQLTASATAPIALSTIGWPLLWYVGLLGTAVLAWIIWKLPSGFVMPDDSNFASDSSRQRLSTGQRKLFTLFSAIFLLWSGQYFAYMTWLPQYMIEVHNAEVSGALGSYVLPVVFVALFNVLTGFALRAKIPAGLLMSAGMVAQTIAWWLIPYSTNIAVGIGSLILYGIAAGIIPACLFAMPSQILGRSGNVADAFGIIMTGRNIGVMFGPILLAITFKLSGSWTLGIPIFAWLTTLCLLLCLIAAVRLHRH